MDLASRIKELRKEKHMTQEMLADYMGVSRQAIAKWESGQSSPSTEKLFKLAEVFNISVDELVNEKKKVKIKDNLIMASLVLVIYIIIYLVPRFFNINDSLSIMGFLFDNSPSRGFSYLYGWLIHQKLFYIAALISILSALFAKRYFSLTTLVGFLLGLILGETFGFNLSGVAYGHDHLGWAIWLFIFIFSIIMGIILEIKRIDFKSKDFKRFLGIYIVGIILIVIFVKFI